MAKIVGRADVELKVIVELTEDEAGALDALFGYDVEQFLKTFYEKMGAAYLQPYEKGLRSLHAARGFLSDSLARVKKARDTFYGNIYSPKANPGA
jgi:hypothetical protein